MKLRDVLIVAALLTALIASLPAGASATKSGRDGKREVIKQIGQIDGDSETKITLRVVIDGPSADVERFKARSILIQCDSGPSRIDFTALEPITIGPKGGFGVRLDSGDDGILRINGVVSDDDQSLTGSLKTNHFESNGQTCRSPKQTFSTSAISATRF